MPKKQPKKGKKTPKRNKMETVEGDDDLFVVIVESDEEQEMPKTSKRKQVFKIKEEVLDDVYEPSSKTTEVEYLIEKAEKLGQIIPIPSIKKEPEVKKKKQSIKKEREVKTQSIKKEPEVKKQSLKKEPEVKKEPIDSEETEYLDVGYLEGDTDDDYVPEPEEECSEDETPIIKKPYKIQSPEQHRYMMRKPHERQSFVKELMQQYPELEEDKELLVETLCEIMLQVKVPPLPPDIFVMNETMFECATCGSVKDTVPAMERHWQEKHGPRYLICYSCGVDFRSRTNLYKHEKRCASPDAVWVLKARAMSLGGKARSRPFIPPHSTKMIKPKEKSRFQCSQCTATFTNKQSLRSHERAHAGSRPYVCSKCPAAYTSHTGLNRHFRGKHSDEVYICDTCSRPFKSKTSLIVHLNTHKPERAYPCSFCGRRYAQRMALRLHEDRAHRSLPPPCACPVCPKRYPRMSLLKTHMLREHGMNLITRKMFYKALPHLSEAQLKEAMVVMKSSRKDRKQTDYVLQNTDIKQTDDFERTIDDMIARSEQDKESKEQDKEYGDKDDFIDLITKIQPENMSDKTKLIVIENGELIYVDESNKHLYEDQLSGLDVNLNEDEDKSKDSSDEYDNAETIVPDIIDNDGKSSAMRKSVRKKTLKKFADHI